MKSADEIWRDYKKLLRNEKYDEWLNLWVEDNPLGSGRTGRFVIAFGREVFREECYEGKDALRKFFSGSQGRFESMDFLNDTLHKTEDDNVFFCIFELQIITKRNYKYLNYIACKFTLRNGLIEEIIELCDPISRKLFFEHMNGVSSSLFWKSHA